MDRIVRLYKQLHPRHTSASTQWSNSQMTQPDSYSQIVRQLAAEDGGDEEEEEQQEEEQEEEEQEVIQVISKRIRLDVSMLGSLHSSTLSESRSGNALWKQAGSSQDPDGEIVAPLPLDEEEITTLSQLVIELGSDSEEEEVEEDEEGDDGDDDDDDDGNDDDKEEEEEEEETQQDPLDRISDVESSDSADDSILEQDLGMKRTSSSSSSSSSSRRVQRWIHEAPMNFLIEFPETQRQLIFLAQQTDSSMIQNAISQLRIIPLTPENHQKQICRTYMVKIMNEMLNNKISLMNDQNEEEDDNEDDRNDNVVVAIEIEETMEDVVALVSRSHSNSAATLQSTSSTTMPIYNQMEDDVLRSLMESNGMKSRGRQVMIDRLTEIWKSLTQNNVLTTTDLSKANDKEKQHQKDLLIDVDVDSDKDVGINIEENVQEDYQEENDQEEEEEEEDASLESKIFQCIENDSTLYSDILQYKVVACTRVQKVVSKVANVTKKEIQIFLDAQGISNTFK